MDEDLDDQKYDFAFGSLAIRQRVGYRYNGLLGRFFNCFNSRK
jgi:hypothetical protein